MTAKLNKLTTKITSDNKLFQCGGSLEEGEQPQRGTKDNELSQPGDPV